MKFGAVMVVTLVLFTGLIGMFNTSAVVAESIPTTEILYNSWSYTFQTPGIYVIATETNPVVNHKLKYSWEMLKKNVTTEASTEDFISIVVSRGTCPTCGYGLRINSAEKVDYAFVLNASFTDPGWDCIVCQMLKNPKALIPIGNLPAGEYSITLHIDRYIFHCSERSCEYIGTETWTAAFKCSADQDSQLSLKTDKDIYILEENVTITLTNIGNETVMLAGYPAWEIFTCPEGDRAYPHTFAWLLWSLDPGENDTITWNQYNDETGSLVEPGMYVVRDTQGMGLYACFEILPPDNSGPGVTNLIQDPRGDESDPVPAYTNVEVSVDVTDPSGVQNVTLYYKTSTDGGETWSEWSDVAMNNIQGNTWRGEIPEFPDCTWVKYKIVAYDDIKNEATMDNAGEYFIYQVVPEFPTWTSMLLIVIVLTVAISIYKRRLLKTPIH